MSDRETPQADTMNDENPTPREQVEQFVIEHVEVETVHAEAIEGSVDRAVEPTRSVYVPHDDGTGQCWHGDRCGGHLVTTVEATAADLIERGLRPCSLCLDQGDLDEPARCDGCGRATFDALHVDDDGEHLATYCHRCALSLAQPDDGAELDQHEQYRLDQQ